MSSPATPTPAPVDLLVFLLGQEGLRALGKVLAGLQETRPATLLVVLDTLNAEILHDVLGLEFRWATPGTLLRPGLLYVARPDVTVESRIEGLAAAPLPARDTAAPLDILLRSVAAAVESRSLTVILGPVDVAGGAGVQALSAAGGIVLHTTPGVGLGYTLSLLIRPRPDEQAAADEATAQAAAILERMGDAHCLLDHEFRIRSVNAATERLLGVPRERLQGRSHWEVFPATADAPIGGVLRQVVQDGTEQHFTHHYTWKSYDLHLDVDAYPTEEGGVSMFFRDVTGRVRAEAALRESEEKYRALSSEMDEAYAVVEVLADKQGNWVDFLFLDVNPAFMRHTGMPYPVGRTGTEVLSTPALRWTVLYGQVAQTGVPLRVEERQLTRGRVFDMNIIRLGGQGSRRVAALFTDMTERQQAQEALQESERALQAYLLQLSDALRPLADPEEIQATAARTLGEHLGANQVHYGETIGEYVQISQGYGHGLPPMVGRFRALDFGARLIAGYRHGQTQVSHDINGDPEITPAEREVIARAGFRAYVAVPLLKGGEWVVTMAAHSTAPRVWTDAEIQMVEETAERTWAAVERARAERALVTSEEKYRMLFESIEEGLCLMEVEFDEYGAVKDLLCSQVNTAFERHTGLRNVIGRRASELVPHLEHSWLDAVVRVQHTGSPERLEHYNADLDRWITTHYARVGGVGSPIIAAVFNDVTEQRQRDRQQAFLLRFSDALRVEPDVDAVASRALQLLRDELGLDRCFVSTSWLTGHHADVIHQLGNDQVPPLPAQFSPSGVSSATSVMSNGTIVVDDNFERQGLSDEDRRASQSLGMRAFAVATVQRGEGQPIWSLGGIYSGPHRWKPWEITLIEQAAERTWAAIERAQAGSALVNSESRLRALVEQLPGGAVFMVDRELRYVMAQGEALAAAGYRAEDFLGRPVAEVMRAEVVGGHEASYRRALAGESFEHEHAAHGRLFLTRGVPLRDAEGEIFAVLAVSYDITDRKRAEEQVRAMNVTLEARVAERTQRLTELNTELMARTRALEAFSHLTRDLSLETDRSALVRRAQELVMTMLPEGFAAYYEPEGHVWRKRAQVGEPGNAALQAMMDAGLPLEAPSFAHPFRSGQPEYQAAYVPGTDTPADVAEHVHSTAALPVRVGGAPIGLFAVVQFRARAWSPADRALLETVVQHLNLALDRAESIRRLAEEREALRAFAQFTHLAARTSDVPLLAQQATDVLHQVLGADFAMYLEREDELWKGGAAAGHQTPALQQLMIAGLPAHTTSFMMPAARREPMFFEHWNPEETGLVALDSFQALAVFPLFPEAHSAGMLSAAKLGTSVWTDQERAIFQAVGEAFRLAMERTAQVQQIERQRGRLADLNAELGTLITRTAHQLEVPARQLEELFGPGSPSDDMSQMVLSALDPAALQDEVSRLRAVAQDLRDLSVLEVQRLDVELLALGELVNEVRGQSAMPGREVTWFTEPLPIIRGDRALLRQALHVLMTFTLSPTRGTRFVTVSSREAEGEVRLVIQDDGVGLSGEEAATLFDVAVRTDQSVPLLAGGGLVQVRRILARHGGWAWAEGERTGGRVVLAFPQEVAAGDLDALLRGDGPRP